MVNRVMASLALALTLSLVLLDLSSANAGVDLPDKAGTAHAAPHEYVFKSEIATKAVVLPIGNLDFLKSLPVHDPDISEPKEDQSSKPDDENEAWLEVKTESIVGAVQPSDSDSGPFTVLHLGHRHHNCRHKPWFKELPHNENDESFSTDNGEDVSLHSMILGVMHLKQGNGHENWKRHSSMPQRGGAGDIHGVRGFKTQLDDQEKMESKQEEDEKSENEAKEEQEEKEVEKTEAEPKDVKTEYEAKEGKTENLEQMEEETESKETEHKTEAKAKEELEKETTEKQVLTWLNGFRKFMNF